LLTGKIPHKGGTHQAAFREAVVKTIREFYKKEFDASDIRASIVAAIAIKVQEPVFESQTKTKLGLAKYWHRMGQRFVVLLTISLKKN
jgi:topoisomerase-4 subunit B